MKRQPHAVLTGKFHRVAADSGLGVFSGLAAQYILLSAGTHVLSERLQITKYIPWMRGVVVLWRDVLSLGTTTHARGCVPGLFGK